MSFHLQTEPKKCLRDQSAYVRCKHLVYKMLVTKRAPPQHASLLEQWHYYYKSIIINVDRYRKDEQEKEEKLL